VGEHHIGLDIGSFAVRAAEVSMEAGAPVLHRFAQLTLPPRSVVEGEIVDRAAVVATLRDLWEKGGFKSRRVVVGVSTRHVKVRQAEVPALSPEEVRSAMRYETQDVMPFADEESVVDFLVQDRFSRDGLDMLRVLVVAASRAGIDAAVEVAIEAGLAVEAIDLTPFALVRALGTGSDPALGEVIVSVGAGLTTVVVHAGGVPQMVRTTAGGGGAITEALASGLSLDYAQAEAVKRAGSTIAAQGAMLAGLVNEHVSTVVQDIAGSIDYFLAQTSEAQLRRVVLSGSGALVTGLRERIARETHLTVVPADALVNVSLGKTRLTAEQLVAAATTLAAPIGLAMAPLADPSTRLTALLPESYAQRVLVQRQFKMAIAAVCVLALVLGSLWIQRSFTVRAANHQVAHAARLQNALVAREVPYLKYGNEETGILRQATVVNAALTKDTDASALLDRISSALPPDVWLQSLTLTLASASAKIGGSVTFNASGVDGDSPARWLASMRSLPTSFSDVWVSSVSATGAGGAGKSSVAFVGKATLAAGVLSRRADSYKLPK
jgi:type IV pilus assembly protein PilM